MQREIGQINALLPQKADMLEVESMQDKAVLQLQDQLKKTTKKFMDKSEIKKAMATI